MSGQNKSALASPARLALSVLELPYRIAVNTRNMMFAKGFKKTTTLPCATISVGNITTGGTGKTPMVIEIALRLISLDANPAILLRGYKATNNHSDEAMVLQKELGPSVPVMPNPSRIQGSQAVLKDYPDTDVFILDDGFQHRQVTRDLDLVLIDATEPFGYDHVLPRGLLREPLENLKRAGCIIMTRCEQVTEEEIEKLDQRIEKISGRPPIAHAQHKWIGFTRNRNNDNQPRTTLRDLNVIGVSGIANPQPFLNTLAKMSNSIINSHSLADHYVYTREWLDNLLKEALEKNADAIVTTEKDWVKWLRILEDHPEMKLPLPVYRPLLRMSFMDGGHIIDALLAKTLASRAFGFTPDRIKKNMENMKKMNKKKASTPLKKPS